MTTAVQNRGDVAAARGSSPAGVEEVSPREVHEWLKSGEAVVVDVREADEHARERIAGSRLVMLTRFDPEDAGAGLRPGQRLVMHCQAGRRGADAARMSQSLAKSGIIVCNMTGGLDAWKKENLPTQVDTRVCGVSVLRQVQLVVGVLVLAGAALAYFVHPGFLIIPAFFGAGLTFAGASGMCMLAMILGKMPWNHA